MQRVRTRGRSRSPGTHHQIERRELSLMQAKGLANDAPQPVARDRTARGPYRHRSTEARRAGVIRSRSHHEQPITHAPPAGVSGIELPLAPQT